MDVQKVGQFLATLRKERGLTQDELGQRVGVTNKTISRWETGTYLLYCAFVNCHYKIVGQKLVAAVSLSSETAFG